MSKKETVCSIVLILNLAFRGAVWGASPETNEPAVKFVLVELTIGRVLHVNTNYNYVILRCGSLPSSEEEAKLWHGDVVVARLKISGSDRFPFVAADIIDGYPREGDLVKQTLKKCLRSP